MVLLLPGLAADSRLFQSIQSSVPELNTPTWIEPLSEESLKAYAKRFADQLPYDQNTIIGGMSFGGQVALEMARVKKPKAVLLISSHLSDSELTGSFKFQQALIQKMPEGLIRFLLKNLGISKMRSNENLNEEDLKLLEEMASSTDISFFKWAASAAAHWDFDQESLKEIQCPVFQIHGRHDYIIPCHEREITTVLEDGKHLINFTHADEVSQWIQNTIQNLP
jgi:pimeloyl-ACP methyl ester carboxylesterase